MERFDYFLKRLLLVIPTFIGITLVCFTLTRFLPGGPVEQRMAKMRGLQNVGERGAEQARAATEHQREWLRKHYGFDKPVYVQYWNWLWNYRIGLTMPSYRYENRESWELIVERFNVSLIFGLTGLVLSYLVCIPLGITKALRNGSTFDLVSSVIVFTGYAIPPFAFGMLLKMLFAGTVDTFWDIFPVAGFVSDNFEALTLWGKVKDLFMHMFLPTLCYVIGNFALLTLLMKNSLLEQVGKDYIRTVLAKGGTERRAIWGHALRNSLIPIVTGIGGVLTFMFAGSVLIERVFEIPGMGMLSFEAILDHDYPVFMAILAITSLLGLLGNILSDFCYVLIDPRINFQG